MQSLSVGEHCERRQGGELKLVVSDRSNHAGKERYMEHYAKAYSHRLTVLPALS